MNNRRRNRWIIGIVILLIVLCFGCLIFSTLLLSIQRGPRLGVQAGRTVAVVDVEGMIVYGDPGTQLGAGGMVYSEQIVDLLESLDQDPAVGAIVLNVNSPGGSVVASEDIYRALVAFSKPSVTSMGETAASGGYYIAAPTDRILVRPATMTGSIGVIMTTIDAEGLLEILGLEMEVIKSGPLKDIGSPYRSLTPEEENLLQEMIDQSYERFIQIIVEGRDMDAATVRELADGRIMTGRTAVEVGLADAEGNLDDAIALAGELADIPGEPNVRRMRREPSLMDILLFSTRTNRSQLDTLLTRALVDDGSLPQLLYLHDRER